MATEQLMKSRKTFNSLVFYPISNHMQGCMASCDIGEGPSTVTLTCWGGINKQQSDGAETFDVKITDREDKLVRGVLKQQTGDDITALIDNLWRQHAAAKRRYHKRQHHRVMNRRRG